MSNQNYYAGGPQYPQQAYGPPQGYPPQGYPPQGYPPQQYGNYPPQQMQYQQGPPQQVIVKEKKDRGCLGSCLAMLCCCFVCEEGCDTCADCFMCCEDC